MRADRAEVGVHQAVGSVTRVFVGNPCGHEDLEREPPQRFGRDARVARCVLGSGRQAMPLGLRRACHRSVRLLSKAEKVERELAELEPSHDFNLTG